MQEDGVAFCVAQKSTWGETDQDFRPRFVESLTVQAAVDSAKLLVSMSMRKKVVMAIPARTGTMKQSRQVLMRPCRVTRALMLVMQLMLLLGVCACKWPWKRKSTMQCKSKYAPCPNRHSTQCTRHTKVKPATITTVGQRVVWQTSESDAE